MKVNLVANNHFKDSITRWEERFKLYIGSYGSSKSYCVAQSLILLALKEKRRILVVRQVSATLHESCYSLLKDVVYTLGLENVCKFTKSPLSIKLSNGSEFIFRGTDDPVKLKSIHNISCIWLEEASELSLSAFEELNGRLRANNIGLYMVLSTNPVSRSNWIYKHFFERTQLDENRLYEERVIKNHKNVYYHHSIVTDNHFIPQSYIEQLDELQEYNKYLYNVARLGRFGVLGERVLETIKVLDGDELQEKIIHLNGFKRTGMDFGYSQSYNAVIDMFVDTDNRDLYILKEIYINRVTDNAMAELEEMKRYKEQDILIFGDSAEPKSIDYYCQMGYRMIGAKKYQNSRIDNTNKVRRFRHIYISNKCVNAIRELTDLTFKKDKDDNYIMGQFNSDPHTFSAIWYGLDGYDVANELKLIY